MTRTRGGPPCPLTDCAYADSSLVPAAVARPAPSPTTLTPEAFADAAMPAARPPTLPLEIWAACRPSLRVGDHIPGNEEVSRWSAMLRG